MNTAALPQRLGRGPDRGLWVGLLALLVLLPVLIGLGRWQWQKGESRAAQQALQEARHGEAILTLPPTPLSRAAAESLQYRRLTLTGRFLPERQFLLDNRVHRQRAGFHVITPFRPDGSTAVVLINRGWLPAAAEHRTRPQFATPDQPLELSGSVVLPPRRFFSLSTSGNTPGWQDGAWPVWQHLELETFAALSRLEVQPLIVQLAPEAPGGFVRDWPRPDQRMERHYAYALQWFAFAFTAFAIWLYFLLRRWRS